MNFHIKNLRLTILLFFVTSILVAQTSETISLQYDTSGYARNSNVSFRSASTATNDTIPTLKSEMSVGDSGALTYMVPVEVFKGINNFQPNIGLAYNSQSGNGQAGWGWNMVGLSSITRGGKSKTIDGIAVGPQFEGSDPFYLDGQRLLQTNATTFETEKYSKIKITKTTGVYSFTIQYTDGKVAKYKEFVSGQHYIAVLKDAMDNEIHYNYTVINSVPYITTISYGGTDVSNDKFKVLFIFENKAFSIKSWRNGTEYKNTKVLKEIQVSSTYLTTNGGLYRKYLLTHDKIQGNTVERLIKIDMQNETGQSLRPLQFGYNTATAASINRSEIGISYNSSAIGLGNVAVGDFYGTGKPTPIYENKMGTSSYQLFSPKTGSTIENYSTPKKLLTGRTLLNNKISERDQLITFTTEYLPGDLTDLTTAQNLIDRLKFTFKDITNGQTKNLTIDLKGGVFEQPPSMDPYDYYNNGNSSEAYLYRNIDEREIISGDYNNDGLIDILIIESADLVRPQKIYFAEIGRAQTATVIPIEISAPLYNYSTGTGFNPSNSNYSIELNGDGVPDLLSINKSNGRYSIFKLNLANNTLTSFAGQDNLQLANFSDRTPLFLGDFNGDGLTDFVTPQKIYSIEGSTAAKELQKMNTETQLWWEYTSIGTSFMVTQKNYTAQKLAYIAPSQRAIIKRSSGWDKFWSGKPDSYENHEYGSSNIIAMDVNNDGKTDLVSFRKFGKAKYSETGKLSQTTIENLNSFSSQSSFVDPTNANKIFFHLTKTNANGDTYLENLPTTIDLSAISISPLSLVLSATDYDQLNMFKSEVIIHDPITQRETRFSINNDDFIEGQLQQIDNGSPIIQKIEHRPMMEKQATGEEAVYSTKNLNLDYPYYIHKNMGTNYLVHKVHTLFDNKILTKEYRYQNGMQHLDGKGFIGFQKTFCSDAYESELVNGKYRIKNIFKGLYWKVNTYNPLFENALSETTYGSLDPSSVFSRSLITNQRFDKGNNRYLILSTLELNTDYLTDITIQKSYQYDTSGDLLLQQANTSYNNQGSSEVKYTYKSEFSNAEHYFFGKIGKVENNSILDGAIFTTKEEQSYNPNGTVLQSKKFGHNTPAITTDFTYYPFGEIQTETLNTLGMQVPLTSSYQYDATNRYVWKITTPDGFVATKNVNPLGRITSEVSGLGLTSSYKYDAWGNVKESTDFLGKKTTIVKGIDPSSPAGSYTVSKKREGGTETIITFDKFDREIKTKSQTINNLWTLTETEYDLFGKKTKISEPYFAGEPILWNTIEYDEINRPIKQTSFNGKVITTCYEKLKVTVQDGHKKTSKTLDAMGNTIKHTDAGGTIYYKYFPNGALKETNYDGIVTKIEIDGWGNKTKLIDPSAGTYLYEYDNLSRIKKETNPKGGITSFTYDDLGRPLTENTNSASESTAIVKNFGYNPTTKLPTTISGTYNGRSYIYTTFYNDPYYRITGKKEQTPEFTFETTNNYDSLGSADVTQLKTTLLANNFVTTSNIKNGYDANGILIKQTDTDTNATVWQVSAINSHGLTTQMQYGNGYTVSTNYNASTFALEKIKHQRGTSAAIVDINYNYDVLKGVLNSRNNLVFNKNETYEYDGLDRLLKERTNGVIAQQYTYDPRGRMTSNTAVGQYNYNEQDYKLQNINFNANGNTLNTTRGFAEVQYNSFKNPTEIFLAGKDRISYDYSILKTRSVAYYGSLNTNKTLRPNRKYFSADKAIEIVKEGTVTKVITYITGDPYSANYMKIDVLNGNSLSSTTKYYIHRDNQNTIVALSKADATGAMVERRYFDAWGNLKEAKIGTSNTVVLPNALGWINTLLIERGYTGHEHLKTVGLIHMNGRLYDPVLRRFLSPDNYVQDPYNTQNYNRFGYVWNNPLLYVDPSGEFGFVAAIIIGAVIGMLTNAINNIINGVPFWYGMGKSGFMGAVSGAISFGIGTIATSQFGAVMSIGKAAFQAGMHAVSSGIMSELQGGTFGSGFAAGAISSLISSGIESLGQTGGVGTDAKGNEFALRNNFGDGPLFKATMLAAGGLSGGISSSIAGGNFWAGVRQGLITSGLNHAAHSMSNKTTLSEDDIKNIYDAYPSGDSSDPNFVHRDDVFKNIGGDIYKDYLSNGYDRNGNLNPDYENTCALRLSTALNKAGYTIPKTSGTFGGANKLNYFYKVDKIQVYLSNTYNFSQASLGMQIQSSIIIQKNCGWSNATGHVDVLYRGMAGSHFYSQCATTFYSSK